jgi:hypothetical protein
VALHELGHGLGFAGGLLVDSGQGRWLNPQPAVYDRFTEDATGVSLLDASVYPDSSAALAGALQSGALFFDGPAARAANGGQRVPIYAPAQFSLGSSYAHLDDSFAATPNGLMTHEASDGESLLHPGWVTLGIFQDMGWAISDDGGPAPSLQAQPHALGLAVAAGGVIAAQPFTVTVHRPDAQWQVAASSQGDWLLVTPASATGSGVFTVTLASSDLAPGYYAGQVTVKLASDPAIQTVAPVALHVTGPANTVDLIDNGDFEADFDSEWSLTSAQGGAFVAERTFNGENVARSGKRVALLGLFDQETADLTLTRALPADGAPVLVYHLQVDSQDLCGFDQAEVRVNNTVLARHDLCAPLAAPTWQMHVLELAAFAGQAATIQFRVTTDDSRASTLLLDDIALLAEPEETPATPQLAVAPAGLHFTATVGAANPAAQSLTITNVGEGALTWSAAESIPWLSLSANTGTAPATLSISVDAAGLAPDLYTGQLVISAPGAQASPQTIAVNFRLESGPDPDPDPKPDPNPTPDPDPDPDPNPNPDPDPAPDTGSPLHLPLLAP